MGQVGFSQPLIICQPLFWSNWDIFSLVYKGLFFCSFSKLFPFSTDSTTNYLKCLFWGYLFCIILILSNLIILSLWNCGISSFHRACHSQFSNYFLKYICNIRVHVHAYYSSKIQNLTIYFLIQITSNLYLNSGINDTMIFLIFKNM